MKVNLIFDSLRAIKRILNRKEKYKLCFLVLATFTGSVLDVVGLAGILPLIKIVADPAFIDKNKYVRGIYNYVGFSSHDQFIIAIVLALFVIFLLKNSILILLNYFQFKFTADLSLKLIAQEFDKYFHIGFWNLRHLGSSRVLNYVNSTPNIFTTKILNQLIMLFTEASIAGLIVIGVALYRPLLFLFAGILLGTTTWISYTSLKNRQRKIGEEQDRLRPLGYAAVHDAFHGYADVQLANQQQYFLKRYMDISEEGKKYGIQASVMNLLPQKLMETVAILGIVLIVFFMVFGSHGGSIVVILGLYVAAIYRLLPSTNRILQYLMTMKQGQFAIKNFHLFNKEYDEKKKIDEHFLPFTNSICFKDVSFTFPDDKQPTLKNISFTVKKGERVGFIGPTGCGKTTLLNVLLQFYDGISGGSIVIDDTELTEDYVRSWWDKIGYVRQDVYMFDGTLRNNIAIGDQKADDEKLWRLLKICKMDEFVNSLPKGLDTLVGEMGSRLSGGQKQRLAIARALYRNVEILVFDEATSALDNKTEQEITDTINDLSSSEVTMFIVAHRFTTLRDCDRIYEIQDGSIVAEHSYQELALAMS